MKKINILTTYIMDFILTRLQQQESARQMMYQNSGYQFERRKRKTLVLDVSDDGTNNRLTDATRCSLSIYLNPRH